MGRGEPLPEVAEPRGMSPRDRLWSDFSFVASSGYREKVLRSLAEQPKLPKQLALDTNYRIVHVSRALRELRERGLVVCLTPETKARGRVYGITASGSAIIAVFRTSSHRYVPPGGGTATIGFVPKIRASLVLRCLAYLIPTRGEGPTRAALRGWSVNVDEVTEDTWLSVDSYDEFFELLEASFGDGSYGFIRDMCFHTVPTVSAVKEQILKIIPLETLAENAPIVYNKEWNYGRLEVRTGKRWAAFLHYDWQPTPPMCAMFQGTYEGILHARRVKGVVTKTKCVRLGDDHCEYRVEW